MATFGKPTEQDAAQYPREFALYTLLDKKHDGKLDAQEVQAAVKKLGAGSADLSGDVSFAQLAKALTKKGEPAEGKGECLGIAVKDKSDSLKPWRFERRPPGPRDVFIQVVYSGICHSDLHQVKDEWGGSIYPMVPGHEIAGIVCSVGKEVKGFKIGEKVGIGTFVDSCRQCHSCDIQDENYCPKCVVTYNGKDKQGNPTYGGYSTHIVVDYQYVLHVPDNLAFEGVAPLLCAGITTYSPLKHYGFDKPGFKLGIVGLGGLGHMGVLQAKAMGCEVTVISTSEKKKDEALKVLGADHFLISKNEDDMKAHEGKLHGIIDTVSAVHDIPDLLKLLDNNGTICVVGVPSEPMHVPHMALLAGRKRVGGSMTGGIRETQEMLDFCGKHNIVCKSEVIDADYVNTAYERLMKNDVYYRFVIDVLGSLLVN